MVMATYKVLYWQEIPSQIKAEDDEDEQWGFAVRARQNAHGFVSSSVLLTCSHSLM